MGATIWIWRRWRWVWPSLPAPALLEPQGIGPRNGGGFVANGVRSDMNNFILDGVDNNAKIPDLSSNSNVIIQPSVDALIAHVEDRSCAADHGTCYHQPDTATPKAH